MDTPFVTIGHIRRPHGVLGHVKAETLSDAPGRFIKLKKVWLEFPDGRRQPLNVEECRQKGTELWIKFETIDTPETAGLLKNAYIQVPVSEKAALPQDTYYVFDLIGSCVVSETGEEIGKVREVLSMPASDVFVVATPRGETLIPAVRAFVTHIDPENRRIVVRPIPGLLEP
ncbi:MAG: 16S rRNA processing protein RimM [candidate division Zixibacteria bacterium]|nr:16S rRNA processing protein RimM [candidate division Zixibacteria bacterium]